MSNKVRLKKKKTITRAVQQPAISTFAGLIIPIIIFLAIQLLVSLLIAFFCGENWLPEEEMSNISTAVAALIALPALFACDRKLDIFALNRESFQKEKPFARLIPAALICLFGAVFLNVFLNGLVLMTGIQDIDPLYKAAASNFAEGSYAFRIIAYAIIVPLAEECLFRGITYKFFSSRLRGTGKAHWAAIFLTSLTFAVYHANFTQGIYTFLLSVALCKLVDFGGLSLSITLHIGMNLTSLIGNEIPAYVDLIGKGFSAWPQVLLAGLVFLFIYFVIERVLMTGQKKVGVK